MRATSPPAFYFPRELILRACVDYPGSDTSPARRRRVCTDMDMDMGVVIP